MIKRIKKIGYIGIIGFIPNFVTNSYIPQNIKYFKLLLLLIFIEDIILIFKKFKNDK